MFMVRKYSYNHQISSDISNWLQFFICFNLRLLEQDTNDNQVTAPKQSL